MSTRYRYFVASLMGLAVFVAAVPARAHDGPVIAIPSRPGVPIIINGVDASYAVVEGDWGLSRPSIGITVIGGRPLAPSRIYRPRDSYHPRYGRAPLRGRNEVEPPPDRALPEPAESFSRSWSTSSDLRPAYDLPSPVPARAQQGDEPPVPPTIHDPQPYDPPTVVVPRGRRRP